MLPNYAFGASGKNSYALSLLATIAINISGLTSGIIHLYLHTSNMVISGSHYKSSSISSRTPLLPPSLNSSKPHGSRVSKYTINGFSRYRMGRDKTSVPMLRLSQIPSLTAISTTRCTNTDFTETDIDWTSQMYNIFPWRISASIPSSLHDSSTTGLSNGFASFPYKYAPEMGCFPLSPPPAFTRSTEPLTTDPRRSYRFASHSRSYSGYSVDDIELPIMRPPVSLPCSVSQIGIARTTPMKSLPEYPKTLLQPQPQPPPLSPPEQQSSEPSLPRPQSEPAQLLRSKLHPLLSSPNKPHEIVKPTDDSVLQLPLNDDADAENFKEINSWR